LPGDVEGLAEQLKEIEQLFVLHGGERQHPSQGARPTLFSWGHLKVLQRIGEGSFGEVFLAYDEILDRDVALKLLKTGKQRPFQSQLFLHEARQLALVRHPNVLAVHGAAIHEGRPGLWCDLINGKTLSDLDSKRAAFSQADWLALIESLALGLRAVHDAGLLHGDVKPSNIMQDHGGQWVLMDFGASLDRSPEAAGPAMASGTPLYMAPEAVLGQSPSTSSDVYSLGATLYRASTGVPVHQADDWDALRELHRRAAPIGARSLERRLGRPLARLVASMLDHDPDARPRLDAILASIDSIRAAPQRRFRRIAIGAITTSLLLGLIFTSWGLIQANQARAVAEQEQRNTAAVNDFLQRLLSAPDESGRVRDMTVEEMLDFAARDVERQFTGQPEAQAAVHLALAESYQVMDLDDDAIEQANLGLEKLKTISPLNDSLEPALELEIIAALESRGDLEDVIARAETFETTFRDRLPRDSDWFLFARKHRVTSLLQLNRLDEAERLLETLLPRVPDPETATNNLGYTILVAQTRLHQLRGRFDEAIGTARATLDWLNRHPQQRLLNRVRALDHLAVSLQAINRKQEALDVMGELNDLYGNLFGQGSTDQFRNLSNMSGLYYALGDLDSAQAIQSRAMSIFESNPDRITFRELVSLRANMANVLNAQQRYDEGEALIRELMRETEARFDERYEYYLLLSYNLTELLNILQRYDEALPQAERTTALMREAFGENHPFVWLSESNRAQSLAGLGRADEAMALHDLASRAVIDAMGLDHPFSLTARRQALESRHRLAPGSVSSKEVRTLLEVYIRETSREHPETRKTQALLDSL
jgi:serine/threonine protein kinase